MTKPRGNTKPRQFRLADETLSLIDQLGKKLGLTSRADVLRVAVSKLAAAELPARKKSQKSPE